jgi:hypothetical protein
MLPPSDGFLPLSGRNPSLGGLAARLAAILTVLALALGACGGDDEPTAPAGGEGTEAEVPAGISQPTEAPGPCGVLHNAAVIGAVGPGASSLTDRQFGLTECAYEGKEPEKIGETAPALYITFGDASAFENYSRRDLNPEPVKGIGKEAILLQGSTRATGGGTAGLSLVVRTADRTVIVAWSLGGAPGETAPEQAELKSMAESVLAGL